MNYSRRILNWGAGVAVMLAVGLGIPAVQAAARSQFVVIRSVVRAETDNTLKVNDATIKVPATAYCTEDGRSIMPQDIRVGDQVRVVAFYDAAYGTRLARSIRDWGHVD